jgi:hypothetical protein
VVCILLALELVLELALELVQQLRLELVLALAQQQLELVHRSGICRLN